MTDLFLIAEAGVNHNGDPHMARALIEVAADAGADAVKFQTFQADRLIRRHTAQAEYQKRASANDQYAMLKELELSADNFAMLAKHARQCGIEFMSTAFDSQSLRLLSSLGVKRLKIPSGELTTLPFVIEHSRLGLPIILSTGMASLPEIEDACAAVLWGRHHVQGWPGSVAELRHFFGEHRHRLSQAELTLLHCTSAYPAPIDSLNLAALATLAGHFRVPVGYSDHSLGNEASLLTIGLGARVIEKHFTLDTALPGPDHQASMSPDQLKQWVRTARKAMRALGLAEKRLNPVESDVCRVARKSLVADRHLKRGETFTATKLSYKRPGTGRPPADVFSLIGQIATRDYRADEDID